MKISDLSIPKKPVGAKRWAVISDIHLEHRRTPTAHIIANLKKYLFTPEVLITLDAIIVAGDTFDRLVNLPNFINSSLGRFFTFVLRECMKYNVALRFLNGTDLHEWGQSKLIVQLAEDLEIDVDVRYYDDITIVKDDVLGFVFGYIPDNHRDTAAQTTKEFIELMKTHGYSKLDFLIMHGFMDFQVPVDSPNAFNSKVMEDLVRYNIYIGHDHIGKTVGKVLVPSSFDKTRSDEVGDHGYIIVDSLDGIITNHRIINHDAMKYEQLKLTDLTDEEVIQVVEDALEKQRSGYLKIILSDQTTLRPLTKKWMTAYPAKVTVEYASKIDEIYVIDESFTMATDIVAITEKNIAQILIKRITETSGVGIDIPLLEKEIDYIKVGM